jgi:hypothetical protein
MPPDRVAINLLVRSTWSVVVAIDLSCDTRACRGAKTSETPSLDELQLTEREPRSKRLMPDGRPLDIIVETACEEYEHANVLELIRDSLAKASIALFIKPMTREVLRKRVTAGSTMMTAFNGLDNALPAVDTPPSELAPTSEDRHQRSQWGFYLRIRWQNRASPRCAAGTEIDARVSGVKHSGERCGDAEDLG